jgi:integrase
MMRNSATGSSKPRYVSRRQARPQQRLSLPTFLLKELKVWRLACPHSPYDLIFPNLDGQPMSHSNLMQRGFFPALQRAGISRIRFHDLRHTFASLMISNGEDILRVSRLMGHATASFTLNVYSHMILQEHDPSGDRLASSVFGNKMETVATLPTQLERPSAENLSKSA